VEEEVAACHEKHFGEAEEGAIAAQDDMECAYCFCRRNWAGGYGYWLKSGLSAGGSWAEYEDTVLDSRVYPAMCRRGLGR
jgi:hypothetical protein